MPLQLSHPRRRAPRALLAAGFAVLITLSGLAAVPASAATVCTGDVCVIVPDTLQTPLGPATITVSAAKVVTVALAPTAPNTFVLGLPFTLPSGVFLPGCPGGCSHTRVSLATSGGIVTIDTFLYPPGPPIRLALPNIAIVSIHPPSPCRARTTGTTVVFTPITTPAAAG